MSGKPETIHPGVETILAFVEGRANREDGERVLIHLHGCASCRAALAFVCRAAIQEKNGDFPAAGPADSEMLRAALYIPPDDPPAPMIRMFWDKFLAEFDSPVADFVTDFMVIAAGENRGILYFEAAGPKNAKRYWRAAMEIPDPSDPAAALTARLTDRAGRPVAGGRFILCGISAPVCGGVAAIPCGEFRRRHGAGGVALEAPDGTAAEGVPVLGPMA